MKKAFFPLIFLIFSHHAYAATEIALKNPVEGANYTNTPNLELKLNIKQLDETDAKIILFQSRDNRWEKVNEIPLDSRLGGDQTFPLFSVFHFCEDVYAVRIMSGAKTLAGPAHFKAGSGTCWFNKLDSFVNLEQNLTDLAIFKPANQLKRDTCGSFAGAAALEAAYHRLLGVNVLLSQNYLHHIIKSSWLTPTPFYLFENQTSFWGGNSTVDALRFLSAYTVPPVNYATYQDQSDLQALLRSFGYPDLTWNPNPQLVAAQQNQIDDLEYSEQHIPLSARLMAQYGALESSTFSGLPSTEIPKIETRLRNGQEVLISIQLTWRNSSTKAKTKIYDSANKGNHLILIVGYDKTNPSDPYFLVKNSWGEGVLRVNYDVFRNQTSLYWGVIQSVKPVNGPNPSRWIGRWQMQHDRWRGVLILRRLWEVNLNRTSEIGRAHV